MMCKNDSLYDDVMLMILCTEWRIFSGER